MSSQNTLKEIAVFAISTAEDINDTIHVIVDYRVGICPFNVNKCDVTDTFLPHGVAGITTRICTTLENSGNISNRSFLCFVSSILETVMLPYSRVHNEFSRTFSAGFQNLAVDVVQFSNTGEALFNYHMILESYAEID